MSNEIKKHNQYYIDKMQTNFAATPLDSYKSDGYVHIVCNENIYVLLILRQWMVSFVSYVVLILGAE